MEPVELEPESVMRRPTAPGLSFDCGMVQPRAQMRDRAHFRRCVTVVVRKNFVLKLRAWQSTLMELLLPVLLMLLIIWIRVKVEREDVPQMSYVDVAENNPTWFTLRNISEEKAIITKLGAFGQLLERLCNSDKPSGLCPEIYSQATWLLRQEYFTGMALDGLLLMHLAVHNQQIGVVGAKPLAAFIEGLPGYGADVGRSSVRHFDDSTALQDYISQKEYGFVEDSPQLFGVIEVRGEPVRGDDGKFQGDWDVIIHLNATGPSLMDASGATAVNTKAMVQVKPHTQRVSFTNTKKYWSGGVLMSSGTPIVTGGFVDLQALLYAWIYGTSGAFTLPSPEELRTSARCECASTQDGKPTQDFRQCDSGQLLLQVLTPHWSTAGVTDKATLKMPIKGCYGRFSGLFPISMREVPMPTVDHVKDKFASIVSNIFGLFFTMVFLWPLTRIMKCMTEDKEYRINEVMKMMGLPAEAINLGWYATYAALSVAPSLMISMMCWTTVFRLSDKLLVAIFFWIFNICVVALCSLLAVFFEHSKTASIVGALLYFLMYFPYVNVKEPNKAGSTKLFACFCPPVAVSFGASAIAELESDGLGLHWSTLGEDVGGISVGGIILMMMLDSILFAALAWYLDKVLVVGFGTRQPWNFLFTRRYWFPYEAQTSSDPASQVQFDDMKPRNPRYEPVTAEVAQRSTILLRGMKKFFTTQEGQLMAAVQGLTVNLYENMVFVLLGHNGAGKSTTFNMLSGMLPIDEGDAVIYGRSAKSDMPGIRKILGACPQHDVIWAQLTVKEHLEFYAAVKSVPPDVLEAEVLKIIADVGLSEKVNSLAGTMSGGQKRRLSAAIALIGGSKVVFLDEPSSGVDPFSRRELWDCLKEKKLGRTIIMTTHFMDEAEELGDRIGIMAAGQIKCVGSSLFLKAQYGVGYTVTMTKTTDASKEDSDKPAELRRTIMAACPSAQMLSDAGVELVYRMPLEESKAFPSLFECFEKDGDSLGVSAFCVSVTTLEEVFLRVGKDETEVESAEGRESRRSFVRQLSEGLPVEESSLRPPVVSAGLGASAALARSHNAQDVEAQAENLRRPLAGVDPDEVPTGFALLLAHVHALMEKRFRNSMRDRKAWCCQVGVPLIFLVFALASLKFTGVGSYPVVPMTLGALPGDQTVVYGHGVGVDAASVANLVEGLKAPSVVMHSVGVAETTTDFNQKLLDEYFRGDGRSRFVAYRFQHVPEWGDAASSTRAVGKVFEVANYRQPGFVQIKEPQVQTSMGSTLRVPVGTLWNEIDELSEQLKVPMYMLNNRLQVDVFWNTTARDAVPILYNELNNQVLRLAMDKSTYHGEAPSVKLYNQPFTMTASQKDLADTQTSLFLALGFAFIPASYGAFVVLERETNSKHLQIISGVNFVSYWLATWLWDLINYLAPAVVSIITIAAFGVDSLVSGENLFWTTLCVLFYGLSCTSFTYMLSFLFKSHTSAQNMFVVIYLFTGGILQIVAMVLSLIDDTKELVSNVLIYFFRLMPNFCLADALMNLILRKNPLYVSQLDCPREGCSPSHMKIAGWDLLYMGLGSLIWFGITLTLELAVATPKLQAWLSKKPPAVEDDQSFRLDQDVARERQRVLRGEADGEMVVLKGLRKVFPGRPGVPPKVAVRDMFFGIPEGECFGYLGMNGAGKTTTMKILTGEDLASGGEAKLGGFDISTEQQQVRRLIGYCPQFDALIGKLTAREHLRLFARIKGVAKDRLQAYVDVLLERLTLGPYSDRQAATFSGGTKRKLSLGIALVGNPRIVFLDEPTTGVDPESRRFMWTLISATMKGRSVILTTHSMDECEALCARIGIMVNGSLVCLGSAAHLKDRHGAGYQFDIAFSTGINLKEAYRRMVSFVSDHFREGARLMEGTAGAQRLKFRLPKGVMPMSGIFRIVESARQHLFLAEYSVSETTLDQIFINFAKNQLDEVSGMSLAEATGMASFPAQRESVNEVSVGCCDSVFMEAIQTGASFEGSPAADGNSFGRVLGASHSTTFAQVEALGTVPDSLPSVAASSSSSSRGQVALPTRAVEVEMERLDEDAREELTETAAETSGAGQGEEPAAEAPGPGMGEVAATASLA